MQDRLAFEITRRKTRSPKFRWNGLVLDFSCISSVDSTALAMLSEIVADFRNRQLRLCFANVSQSVRLTMIASALLILGFIALPYHTTS